MAKKRNQNEELEVKRTSPYEDMTDEEYDEDMIDTEEETEEEEEETEGFFASVKGKVLLGVLAALVIALLALLVIFFVTGKDDEAAAQLPGVTSEATAEPSFTQAPAAIVFAPVVQATQEPEATEVPVIVVEATPVATPKPTATPVPTNTPEPTATPLPIILSNTPTPSPTPTATPTPSPSPTPTPSPKPTATPQVDLASGETNRDAKLRESASGSGKVKQTVKKGESVTIHEVLLDKDGKVWYALTVDDAAIDGYMRDYVVDVEGDLAKPTATPKATATPKKTAEPSNEMTVAVGVTPAPTAELAEDVIGTGKTNRDANVRKVMNGAQLTTLRKGKTVEILEVRLDKKGEVWYQVRVNGKTGFMRDYVLDLDEGVELDIPTPAPTATPIAKVPEAEEKEETSAAEEKAEEVEEKPADGRTVLGKAKTNRDANVREKPANNGKVARQLSKGNVLNIYAKYESDDAVWYEVATESGKTKGFVRDYVISILNIDKDIETLTYEEKVEEKAEEKPEETEAVEVKAEAAEEKKFAYAGDKATKVFHLTSCELIPEDSKDVLYMDNRNFAVNWGYQACETCKP